MPWVAAGLGGSNLVTQGLGGHGFAIVIELWESPLAFQTRTGTRPHFEIVVDLRKRRKIRQRRTTQGRGER